MPKLLLHKQMLTKYYPNKQPKLKQMLTKHYPNKQPKLMHLNSPAPRLASYLGTLFTYNMSLLALTYFHQARAFRR
jgi:hypothetical protein